MKRRMDADVPVWYWPKGLHDAKILEASIQDDVLILHIGSSGAMFDDTVECITFFGVRLKTPLPQPTKKSPVYWLSDELTELPFGQWKLTVCIERYDGSKTLREPLIFMFQSAETKRREKTGREGGG